MPQSYDAVIDEQGRVTLRQQIALPEPRRAVVTVLDERVAGEATPEDRRSSWKDRYRTLEQLGRGGMGEVFKVESVTTGRILCLKVLYPSVNRNKLQQECRALARLNHPNIVSLVDFDVECDRPALITEFVDGPTLGALLRGAGTLGAARTRQLGIAVFDALRYVHEHGLFHRDLKPENIVLRGIGGAWTPVILDFGLALVDQLDESNRLTGEGLVVGTPGFMAPEQCVGERVTSACDVFAVGVILWEALVGQPAIPGRNAMTVLKRTVQLSEGLVLPSPDVAPAPLAALITACTHPDPVRRPTAAQALERLTAFEIP